MKIKYERVVRQFCEVELSKEEFKNEFDGNTEDVCDWGEETGDFDVIFEEYPQFENIEIIKD